MDERQNNLDELSEALKCFDEPGQGSGQVPEIPEPVEPELPAELPEPEEPDPEPAEELEGAPDFTDAMSVLRWFGKQIIKLIGSAKREKALSRLRALGAALDTWSKLARLSADTSEIQQIRAELDELKRQLEAEKRGPVGVVRQ